MSEIADILDELKQIHEGDAWHGPALRELLNGVTADHAAKRPLENTHSIWELVLHIAGWEDVFRRRLEGESATEPEGGDFPAVEQVSQDAWTRALADLESEHERLLKTVSQLHDSTLETSVAGKDYSVRFLLHGIIRHQVYHAGQIALLRKAFVS